MPRRTSKPRPEATLTDERGQIQSHTFMEGMFLALRKQEKYEERWRIRMAFIDYTDLKMEAQDAVWEGCGEEFIKEFVRGAMAVRDRVCVARCENFMVFQEESRRKERETQEKARLAQADADATTALTEAMPAVEQVVVDQPST